MENLEDKSAKRKRESTGSSQEVSDSSFQEEVKIVRARSRSISKKRKEAGQTVSQTLSQFQFIPRDTGRPESEKMEDEVNRNRGGNNESKEVDKVAGAISLETSSTSSVTNEDLMLKLCANGNEISKLSQVVEELRSSLFTVQLENDELKKKVVTLRTEQEELKQQVKEAKFLAELAEKRAEDLDSYGRRNNIRIYGVKEERGEDCEAKVLNIVHDKLKVDLKKENIEAVHRLGAKKENQQTSRGIIVRFVSRRNRDSVFYAKRNLRDTGIVIAEDLTKKQYSLLNIVKDNMDLCKQAWTKKGQVFMKSQTGRIVHIKSASDWFDQSQRDEWMRDRRDRGPRQGRRGDEDME